MSNKEKIDIKNSVGIIVLIVIVLSAILIISTIVVSFVDIGKENRRTIVITNDQELDLVPVDYTGKVLIESVIEAEEDVYVEGIEGPLLYAKINDQVSRIDRTLFVSSNKWVTEASVERISTGITMKGINIQDVFSDLYREEDITVDLVNDNRRVEYLTLSSGATMKAQLNYVKGEIVSIEKTRTISPDEMATYARMKALINGLILILITIVPGTMAMKIVI